MRCARREAGPPEPAAAPRGRARKLLSLLSGLTGGDGAGAPPPRARLALLPVLALLLGAVFLLPAHPAAAQTTTFWTATLTVDEQGGYFGCDNTDPTQDNCSSTSVLTDQDFTYSRSTYRIVSLHWRASTNELSIAFQRDGGGLASSATKTALGSLTLHVGGTALAVGDSGATSNNSGIKWSYSPNPDWTDGQQVAVKLVGPPPVRVQFGGWTTTLTVDEDAGYFGCDNAQVNCSSALADNAFVYNGITYQVTSLLYRSSTLTLATSPAPVGKLAGLELYLGNTKLTLDASSGGFRWENVNLNWADGQQVTVRLVEPPPVAPPPVTGAFWSTTLTVDQDSGRFGCDHVRATQDNCSVALADDDFEYNGVSYRILALNYFSNHNVISLSLNPAAIGRLSGLELHLGTTKLTLGTTQGHFTFNVSGASAPLGFQLDAGSKFQGRSSWIRD